MKTNLIWDGRSEIVESGPLRSPSDREVSIEISHTLCLGSPTRPLTLCGRVVAAGRGCQLSPDTEVVVPGTELTSGMTLAENSCSVSSAPPQSRVWAPLVAGFLQALGKVQIDMGWNAIVTGSDAWARLLGDLTHFTGARSLVVETSAPANGNLDSAPARSIVHDSRVSWEGGTTSINFYQDVHKKNVRILGVAPVCGDMGNRADRMLQSRLQPPLLREIVASEGSIPESPDGYHVLTWQ